LPIASTTILNMPKWHRHYRWGINMSIQITRDQSFPAACKYCGGVLADDVNFCPYCGMDHPLGKVALRTRAGTTPGAREPKAPGTPSAAATKLSPASMPAPGLPAIKPTYQAEPLDSGASSWLTPRWIFTKGLLLAGFLLAIAYAAHLLVGEFRQPDRAADEQSAHTSSGSISRDAAVASPAENGLPDANAARDPQLDSALRIAEQCAGERVWGCVQQKASEALAIDPGNQHARTLMERAIVATAWPPLSSPNPSNRGAGNASAVASPANPSPAAHTASPASNGNSVEAQERAIMQNGWKQPSSGNAAH
jgi:hypothetical protein